MVHPDGLPTPQRYWSMLAIAIGITMSVLDSAVANIALPTIARELRATPAEAVWIVNAYQLAIVVALLPLASLGERVGYRRVYQVGLSVFTAGSLACALSHSLSALVISRVIQGFGAAGVLSVNGALVRFTYPNASLGRGVGLNGLVVSAAAALGPSVASAILAVATWEWLFAINVPIGIVNVWLAVRALPHSDRSGRRFDWLSAGLNALMFGLFFIGADTFSHGEGRGIVAGVEIAGGVRGRLGAGAPRGRDGPAADPARPAQDPGVRVVRHGVGVRVLGLHARLPGVAVLLRNRAAPQPGRDRPADDAVAGGGRAGRAAGGHPVGPGAAGRAGRGRDGVARGGPGPVGGVAGGGLGRGDRVADRACAAWGSGCSRRQTTG